MAEIPVEKKSSMSWLWMLLLLLAGALIIWWLLGEMNETEDEADQVAVEQTDATTQATGAQTAGAMTLAAILANPSEYHGRSGFTGEVGVAGPLTDRGFWIDQDGERMFALIIDQPAELPVDINEGTRLRLDGGTVRDSAAILAGEFEGDALDADTRAIVEDEDAILIIDETNITIVEAV